MNNLQGTGLGSVRARAAAFLLLLTQGLWAATPLRVEVVTAPNFVVDSNVESPSTYGPRAAYIGVRVWNDTAAALSNVFVYIGDYVDGAHDTPGIYPRRAHMTLTGFAPDGKFALTHEGGSAGTADATRYVGTIPAGGYKTAYWLVSYPTKDSLGHAVWGPSVKPFDDLWLQYDVWAVGASSGAPVTSLVTSTVTLRNEISAMANKIFPNTANQVPLVYQNLLAVHEPQWTNTSASVPPGSTVLAEGYWYTFGNVGGGFDADGNLVPDQDAWMQPVGDPSLFDTAVFRLVHTHALLVLNLKDGGEEVRTYEDQLYFPNLPDNTSVVGWVGYEFVSLNGVAQVTLTPYQEAASGSDNEKFNGDFGATGIPSLSSATPTAALGKTASTASIGLLGTVHYQLSFTNTGSAAMGDPSVGAPFMVRDHVPAGTVYLAGSAAASNTLPSGVAAFTILYSTNNGAGWLTAEPGAATNVTDLQWILSDPLAAGAWGRAAFSATLTNPFRLSSPLILNTGAVAIANGPSIAQARTSTVVQGTNAFSGIVFLDNGAGSGGYANGLKDGTESGITNVTITLYYDVNSNGVADASDVVVASTNSGAAGAYGFTNLFDGRYVAVVDTASTNIPSGATPTTPDYRGADLDLARAITSPVNSTSNNFGFAPSFVMLKAGVGSTNFYEGQYATNVITLVNLLPGNGTANGTNAVIAWCTNGTTGTGNSAWSNYTAAFIPVGPDQAYVAPMFVGSAELLTLTGWNMEPKPGAITNVQIILPMITNGGDMLSSTMTISVLSNSTSLFSITTNSTVFGNSNFYVNVTSVRPWVWSDFRGTVFSIDLSAKKVSGNPSGRPLIDCVGFLIRSDTNFGGASSTTTIDPLPFSDTYNAAQFQYVSASPLPTSSTTNGAPPNTVGTLVWTNAGPLYPGGSNQVTVWFKALQPVNNTARLVTNTVDEFAATYSSGRAINTATAQATGQLNPAGTIGDFVWRDLNGNGAQDAGEPGIPSVRVYLTNGLVVVSTYTDSTGHYLFEGLTNSASYTVGIDVTTLPAGWTLRKDPDGTLDNRTIVGSLNPAATDGSDTRLTNDFGYQWSVSAITGLIWNDQNHNGSTNADTAEPYLTNITVLLYNAGGSLVGRTNTDTRGFYSFTNITVTGNYTVVVTNNTGSLSIGTWIESYASLGSNALNKTVVNIATLGATTNADFSYFQTGAYTIGDTLFFDWNGDGVKGSGDEGIPNISVSLYLDNNSNGVLEAASDPLIGTAVTDLSGQYFFTNLPAGRYIVVVDESDPQFPRRYYQTKDPNESGRCSVCDGMSPVTLSATDLAQDFGYQPYGTGAIGDTVWRDLNANRLQSGTSESGITNVTVTLEFDFNGDGAYVTWGTTNTDASGHYLFAGLPDGTYRVSVSATDASLPTDAFGHRYVATTPTTSAVVLSGSATNLNADFGFAALGAVGDTLFWDANGNGGQDLSESGISNVTVQLFIDVDGSRTFNAGDLFVASTNTDASGRYVFTGLTASNYVVFIDTTNSAPLAAATLTADPNADGQPCGSPGVTGCDGQYGVTLTAGGSFMGADFGYQPPGVLGDTLWIDTDGDGLRGSSEPGVAYVPVELRTTDNTLVATATTDASGYYYFQNVTNGSYKVVVQTTSTNFPAGVSITRDPDGVLDSTGGTIVVSGGHVASIGGTNCSSCDLDLDFGYRYAGGNTLSGTVGMDGVPANGLLGTNATGVNADEAPFAGQAVYIYLWQDNGNGTLDSGETTFLNSTTTATNGDYSFTGLPSGGANNWYLVSLTSPMDHLALTTTAGNTPAAAVVNTTNSVGESLSAYQKVAIAATVTNIDFAYASTIRTDYGDLPLPYPTTLAEDGARHLLTSSTVWLGAVAPDADTNITRNVTATGDDTTLSPDDEDGVTAINPTQWRVGPAGGSVQIVVHGSGYLIGWIDFNNDGAFSGTNEMVVSQAVSSGTATYSFTIPAAAFVSPATNFYARFRVFTTAPSFPELAYTGEVVDGEVEDYQLAAGHSGSISGTVYLDQGAGGWGGDSPMSGVTVRLYADTNSDGLYQTGEPLVATASTGPSGAYSFTGLANGSYVVVETDPSGATSVADVAGANDNFIVANLAGTDITGRDFLDVGASLASISGSVYNDRNANAVAEAGEPPIAGVTIVLYSDLNGNGIVNAGEPVVATTNTSAAGAYQFSSLTLGNYIVVETNRAGSLSTGDKDANSPVANGLDQIAVALASGGSAGNDFLDYDPTVLAALGNRIFNDLNGDGMFNGSDAGISGVKVNLYTNGQTAGVSTPIATATTDASGHYYFEGLLPGSYFPHVPASEFGASKPLLGALSSRGVLAGDGSDHGIDAPAPSTSGVSAALTNLTLGGAPTGESDTGGYTGTTPDTNANFTLDFGFVMASSQSVLGNLVFHDLNNNGTYDSGQGETGIDGVTVQLWSVGTGAGGVDEKVGETVTASGGAYSFTTVPGTYVIRIPTPPASAPRAGSTTGASDNQNHGVQTGGDGGTVAAPQLTLAAGVTDTTRDFGFVSPAPSITCPGAVAVSCASLVPAHATDLAGFQALGGSASGSCGAVTVAWVSDAISSQTCANRYTITRTYQATDSACGTSATCEQTITVNDTTGPVFASFPANATLSAGSWDQTGPAYTGTPTATDGCGGAVTIASSDSGSCVDNTITRTWTATDACGNATTSNQVLTLNGFTGTTAAYSVDLEAHTGTMTFINPHGLASVQAITNRNGLITGTAYDASGSVLSNNIPVSVSTRSDLPAGTVKVVLFVVKVDAGQPAIFNVMAKDVCDLGASFDPVETVLVATGAGPARQTFTGLPAAEHFIRVANGAPGLDWMRVMVNGVEFRLDGLAAGEIRVLDAASATVEGDNNVLTLIGQGPAGAWATVFAGDTAGIQAGEILLTAEGQSPADRQAPYSTQRGSAAGGPAANGVVVSVFENTMPIQTTGRVLALPYPAGIRVAGVPGQIRWIRVSLAGLSHACPAELSALLAGPGGQKVALMSGAGGTNALDGLTLQFDDRAAASISQDGTLSSAARRPASWAGTVFDPPAPQGPYEAALSAWEGASPNGDWELFVEDNQGCGGGVAAGGWRLTLATCEARLTAVLKDGQVLLSWPAELSGFVLQGRPGMSAREPWADVSGAPRLEAGRLSVAVDAAGSMRVFRLVKPD